MTKLQLNRQASVNYGTFITLLSLLRLNYGASKVDGTRSENDYSLLLDEGEDESFANTKMDAAASVSCSSSGLDITVNLGSLLSDSDSVVADPTETKMVKVAILADDTSKALELALFEKTTGEYGNVPAGKTLMADLKEYSLAPAGSNLVEVQSWL